MGVSLREIAALGIRGGDEMLGEQSDRVGSVEYLIKDRPGLRNPSQPGERLGDPERADDEGAFRCSEVVVSHVAIEKAHYGRLSMMPVSLNEGLNDLRALATRSILYAFDFDGTLARISSDRGGVTLSPSTHGWLRELATRAPCAIVSGRALSDLAPRVKGAVLYLIGNHGLESPLTPPTALNLAEGICQAWMKCVDKDLARLLKIAGVEVENKRYTLTFHYQGAQEPARVQKELVLLLNRLTPAPRLIFGKASVNVLPPGTDGKGAAVLALMHHLQQSGLFFIGDDETDEDVFDRSEGLAMTVRVGRCEESRARYFLHHQGEVEDVLRFLVHRLEGVSESSHGFSQKPTGSPPEANER